jgi:hypothetical protein
MRFFALAFISQIVTVAAREDSAAIEDRDASATPQHRAPEIDSLSAQMARNAFKLDRVV